jgi:hypothetical protein
MANFFERLKLKSASWDVTNTFCSEYFCSYVQTECMLLNSIYYDFISFQFRSAPFEVFFLSVYLSNFMLSAKRFQSSLFSPKSISHLSLVVCTIKLIQLKIDLRPDFSSSLDFVRIARILFGASANKGFNVKVNTNLFYVASYYLN